MINSLKFCEECGCKLDTTDKFCTGCGLFLSREDEVKHSKEQTPKVAIASAQERTASAPIPVPRPTPQKPIEQPVESKPIQTAPPAPSTPPEKAAPVAAAAPKSSSKSAVYALVALVAVGGAGAFFMMKGDSKKAPNTTTGSEISQKPGAASTESGNQAPKIKATGQMLVEAAVNGDKDQFQALLHQLQTQPPAATVDRKLARSLNDEALKALKSGDYPAAIETLNKAREADLADAEISNNLGYALRMSGDLKASESQLVHTIEQFPARQQAWSDLGETYSKLGKHSNAVASFIAAHRVAKNPEKLLEKLLKLAESTDDDALKADLTEAAQKIAEAK